MSDDLVKRLRFGVAIDEQGDVSWCSQEVMFNAADHIEKLEAALVRIWAWHPISVSQPRETLDAIRDFAFATIKGDEK